MKKTLPPIARSFFLLFLVMLLAIFSCEDLPEEHESDVLSFPVGRSFLTASTINVTISEKEYHADFEFDQCGGYWVHIPKSDLTFILIRTTGRLWRKPVN